MLKQWNFQFSSSTSSSPITTRCRWCLDRGKKIMKRWSSRRCIRLNYVQNHKNHWKHGFTIAIITKWRFLPQTLSSTQQTFLPQRPWLRYWWWCGDCFSYHELFWILYKIHFLGRVGRQKLKLSFFQYLLYLDSHPEDYLQYLEWKGLYKVGSTLIEMIVMKENFKNIGRVLGNLELCDV